MKEFGNGAGNGNVVVYIDKPEDAISKTIELIESGNIKEKRKKVRKFVEKYSWDNTLDEFDGGLKELERRK